jgi:hypothetical protein
MPYWSGRGKIKKEREKQKLKQGNPDIPYFPSLFLPFR